MSLFFFFTNFISYQALLQMAAENNGQIICPRTKDIFPYKKVEKVFVMWLFIIYFFNTSTFSKVKELTKYQKFCFERVFFKETFSFNRSLNYYLLIILDSLSNMDYHSLLILVDNHWNKRIGHFIERKKLAVCRFCCQNCYFIHILLNHCKKKIVIYF